MFVQTYNPNSKMETTCYVEGEPVVIGNGDTSVIVLTACDAVKNSPIKVITSRKGPMIGVLAMVGECWIHRPVGGGKHTRDKVDERTGETAGKNWCVVETPDRWFWLIRVTDGEIAVCRLPFSVAIDLLGQEV